MNTHSTPLRLEDISGKVHSIQSMGTVDGPGVRFVVFTQGCNLRCSCCHNPDTWEYNAGTLYTAKDIVDRASRYTEYFGDYGGITISGGEPLVQTEFCNAVFTLAKDIGINTCLDTSGSIINDKVKKLLEKTDRVLLDIKYTTDKLYNEHVGCSIKTPLKFLEYLNQQKIATTIRQVIIPTINDTVENIERLNEIIEKYPCIDKVELLPFKKICQVKYDDMNLVFPFKDIPEAEKEKITQLEKLVKIK